MVVRIRTGKRVRGALSYNESKVRAGKATLILASRFASEASDLRFNEKLTRFERLNSLNPKITTNTLHLSLNFSPYDNITTEKMQMIAADYMKRIGFGNQPYLVYRHADANHPHIHIVTTTVRPNGSPINLHNIGKLKSEPARKEIEMEFGLIPAESMKNERKLHIAKETKQSISNIVNEVIRSYHFTNLEEFNLILRQQLVVADTGRPGSRLNSKKGLLYSNCDHNGKKVGTSIKASSIYNSPTLKILEEKFEKEKSKKNELSDRTSEVLNNILSNPGYLTEAQFKIQLAKNKIKCYIEKCGTGAIIDVKFVDNVKKVVLNCNDLKISPNVISAKTIPPPQLTQSIQRKQGVKEKKTNVKQNELLPDMLVKFIQTLTTSEYDPTAEIPEFLRKRKKKRKRKK